MSVRMQCLKRIGENVKKHKLIVLDEKVEVTIGRSHDVTVCILSTLISRCHAVMKKTESGTWTIWDNKSLNGVFVNNKKLEPMKPQELKDGDMVQLGVRTSPEVPPEFVYQYHTALTVKRVRKAEDTTDGPVEKRPRTGEVEPMATTSNNTPDSTRTFVRGTDQSPYGYSRYRQELDKKDKDAAARLAEMEVKLREMQEKLKAKENVEQEMAEQLEMEKQCREKQLQALEDMRLKEEQLKKELEMKQAEVAREKQELEERMREEYEDLLHLKEATLIENLEAQKQALLKEKEEIEKRLKEEMVSEREKDKKLTEELQKQQSKLQQVIAKKEAEQKLLEVQLNNTKLEKDQKQEEALRAREDVLSNFAELMETELQCSICSELFIKATSLNCSHSFCWLCIQQWMKVKKECPNCRMAILTHMRSIVLDSYIEKMVEQFSGEMKKRRQELVEGRKVEEQEFEEANKPPEPAPRGRGRGRRGRGGRARVRGGAARQQNERPAPIVLSDDDDDDDYIMAPDPAGIEHHVTWSDDDDIEMDVVDGISSDDSDSDNNSDISGDSDEYYGGYGRCFTCGSRGHWANGCPYR